MPNIPIDEDPVLYPQFPVIPEPEPVTVAFLKSYSRLTTTGEDELLRVFISAAREIAEAYTRRDYINKVRTSTYAANQNCPIPTADIVSVSGFYTTVDEIATGYNNFIEYIKGSIVNRDYPIDYANLPTYTVTYNVTVNPDDVPAQVKTAICKIAADLYENRENSTSGANRELNINYKVLLNPYMKY